MFDRDSVLDRAYHDCMREMYKKSQPSADYDQLIEDVKSGKIPKDTRIYERYYLSMDEFIYIRDKYMKAYGLVEHWKPDIELLEEYLNEGGTKDKWIPKHVDEGGCKHPGHRSYEKVPPIKKQITDFLMHNISGKYVELGEEITKIVMNTINDCKEFYRFDREPNSFSASIALGPSPNSNPEFVKDYWKSQGFDIEIEDRNPLLFWDRDYYGDDFEEVMKDAYGKDWEKYWDDKWKKELEEKEKQRQEKLKIIKELNNNEDKKC